MQKICIILYLFFFIIFPQISKLEAYAIIKNVADFHGQPFTHIDFEVSSNQDTVSKINTFLTGKAVYSGSSNIRFVSTISSNGGGYDGGSVSGAGHICTSAETISLTFTNPVDAFGFFLGGLHFLTSTTFTATFADNSTANIAMDHLSLAQDGSPSTAAICGFIGVDSNGGQLIKSFSFFHTSDTFSLDDIYFGTANYSGTIGLQPFSENGGGGLQPTLPVAGSITPVPEPMNLFYLIISVIAIYRIKRKIDL